MSRLYIDVTQLVHWPGGLTGIPRVMNELSLRYKDEPNTVFVVWDKHTISFYELDIEQSLANRGAGIFYTASKRHNTAEPTLRSARQVAREAAKKLGGPLKARHGALYQKIRSRTGGLVEPDKGMPVTMGSDDSLFVLWGEWADESYKRKIVDTANSGTRLIQIVYDMLPIITPQYSGHSTAAMYDYYWATLPLCNTIFAISESTKRDITAWLQRQGEEVPDIRVFRLGDDFSLTTPRKPMNETFIHKVGKKPFILCVGTIEARKNHTLLYYTYKLAKERGIILPALVIVGRRGWHTENIYDLMTSDPDTKDVILPLSDISDEELAWLYEHCRFSVYPSFYEGWGLPIAESIAHGKVCASVNSSSMPEVAGDLVPYFSPVSTDECLSVLTTLMSDKELKVAENKLKSYKVTTWNQTYEQVARAIKEKTT